MARINFLRMWHKAQIQTENQANKKAPITVRPSRIAAAEGRGDGKSMVTIEKKDQKQDGKQAAPSTPSRTEHKDDTKTAVAATPTPATSSDTKTSTPTTAPTPEVTTPVTKTSATAPTSVAPAPIVAPTINTRTSSTTDPTSPTGTATGEPSGPISAPIPIMESLPVMSPRGSVYAGRASVTGRAKPKLPSGPKITPGTPTSANAPSTPSSVAAPTSVTITPIAVDPNRKVLRPAGSKDESSSGGAPSPPPLPVMSAAVLAAASATSDAPAPPKPKLPSRAAGLTFATGGTASPSPTNAESDAAAKVAATAATDEKRSLESKKPSKTRKPGADSSDSEDDEDVIEPTKEPSSPEPSDSEDEGKETKHVSSRSLAQAAAAGGSAPLDHAAPPPASATATSTDTAVLTEDPDAPPLPPSDDAGLTASSALNVSEKTATTAHAAVEVTMETSEALEPQFWPSAYKQESLDGFLASGGVDERFASRFENLALHMSGIDGNQDFKKCEHCRQPVTEGENSIFALGSLWHPEHFLCSGPCAQPLAGTTYFTQGNKGYCRTDYLDQFGRRCPKCNDYVLDGVSPGGGPNDPVYHSQCIHCHSCGRQTNEIELFASTDGHFYCERDYRLAHAPPCFVCRQPIINDHETPPDM
jgi:hypothetical protein